MTEEGRIACSEVWGDNRDTDAPLSLPGLAGWIRCRPHRGAERGGDLHYISSCGSGRITRLMLADASGHGEPAGDLSGFLRSVMQRYLNHIDPHKLAAAVNALLSEREAENGRFATALIMTYFSPTGELNICNAGHPPPLLYRSATRTWARIDQPPPGEQVRNLPLGVLEDAGYSGRELGLDPGDVVLSFTDCLTEAKTPDGRQLGAEGLIGALERLDEATIASPGRLIDALVAAIEAGGYRMDDDLTVVAWRSTGPAAGAAPSRRVAGLLKTIRMILATAAPPWPEASVRNLGGGFFQALNRVPPRWRKRAR